MLNCNVVKDLLPNYIDEIVSKKTASEIELHLTDCAGCKATFEKMKTPLAPIITQERKEIDYLRKIKTESKRYVLKYSIIGIVIISSILALVLFIFSRGTPIKSADLQYTAYISDEKKVFIEMRLENDSSFYLRTNVIHDEKTEQMTEFILSPRQVPEPFANGNYFSYEYTPDNGFSENFRIIIRLSDGDIILTADDL